MSYNVSDTNMLQWFYSNFNASNSNNKAPTTNFRINDVDINNDYIGINTNSNIPVTQLYNINYYISDGRSLGSLFELNLPNFLSGTINVDYKIWPPSGSSGSNGLLIQFYTTTNFKFNYKVTGKFLAVGGGGGGGGSNQSNAGGGGGAGGVILGDMKDVPAGQEFTITIGGGGAAGAGSENQRNGGNGGNTTISCGGSTVTAGGGGGGGQGKGISYDVTNASSGGSGSYENGDSGIGTVTKSTPDTGVFQGMQVFCNVGSKGVKQSNDDGPGGGGGGAQDPASAASGNTAGNGGNGYTYSFGTTSITAGGGGGGGAREGNNYQPGNGGSGGGGQGGWSSNRDGSSGFSNTGGGGGGAWNAAGNGGAGGSGTVFFYILPSGVSL